jgi:hypothetical protein
MKPLVRAFGLTSVVAFAAACASVGGGTGGTVTNGGAGVTPAQPSIIWPVKTREHVDLWLHGYAMLQEDTTFVPFFKRGYSTDMIVLKNKANVVTQLDANHDKLRARLTTNPQLVNAQFVPLSFGTWADLTQTVDLFIRANGNPRAASSQEQASAIAILAAYFQTPADRDWLRLFVHQTTRQQVLPFLLGRAGRGAATCSICRYPLAAQVPAEDQSFLNNTQQARELFSFLCHSTAGSIGDQRQAVEHAVTSTERPSEGRGDLRDAHEAIGGSPAPPSTTISLRSSAELDWASAIRARRRSVAAHFSSNARRRSCSTDTCATI